MRKTPVFLLTAALICALPAIAQSVQMSKSEMAESYVRQLNKTLFMAGEKADVAAAKKLADKLIELHIPGVSRRMLFSVYACAAAGTPAPLTGDEQMAVKKDFHNTTSFAPNTNMQYAMAFANGWGVKPDLDRATAFVCHANTYPLELIVETEALDMMADWQKDGTFAKKNKTEPFTFCSFTQSLSHIGQCDVHQAALEQYGNEAEQIRLAGKAGFSQAQLKALQNLHHAASVFFQEEVWKEYPRGGDDAGTRFARRVRESNAAFNHDVTNFIQGGQPGLTAFMAPPDGLDQKWTALLKTLYAHKGDPAYFPGTCTAEMLNDTQYFWQKYHDAWLALFLSRYPAKDTAPLSDYLKFQRMQQIKRLYGDENRSF